MAMEGTLEKVRYVEAALLPKLDDSFDRLVNKNRAIMTDYHVTSLPGALELLEKALEEGNGALVRHDYAGYYIEVWKEKVAGTK